MNRLLGLGVCVLLGSMVAFSHSDEADPFQAASSSSEGSSELPLQPVFAPEEIPAAPALPEEDISGVTKDTQVEEPLPTGAPTEADFEPAPSKQSASTKPLADEPDPFATPIPEPHSKAVKKPGLTFRPAQPAPVPNADQGSEPAETLPPALPTFSSRKVTILGKPSVTSKPDTDRVPDQDRYAQRVIQERAVELARQRRARLEARRWQGPSPYRPQVVYDSPHPGDLKNSMNLTRIPFPNR